jgi:Protein of unknown function (DUF2971)
VLRSALMRAYKFLNAKYGLKSLSQRRLKQSRVKDLNDPFELTPYKLTNLVIRKTFHQTREDVDKEKGLLCFSADWKNPVIWAHYGDKHKGLCLGFDIPEIKGDPANDDTGYVKYVPELLPFPDNFDDLSEAGHASFARQAVFTKFADWTYEHEIRVWGALKNKEGEFYFVNFSADLELKEVIIGQECTLPITALAHELGSMADHVTVKKARAAHDKFEMVEDQAFE